MLCRRKAAIHIMGRLKIASDIVSDKKGGNAGI
jgi:hypothetical protein